MEQSWRQAKAAFAAIALPPLAWLFDLCRQCVAWREPHYPFHVVTGRGRGTVPDWVLLRARAVAR